MRHLLTLAVFAAALPACAATIGIFSNTGDAGAYSISITDEACPAPGTHPSWRKSLYKDVSGEVIGCYTGAGTGTLHFRWSDGDIGSLPEARVEKVAALKPTGWKGKIIGKSPDVALPDLFRSEGVIKKGTGPTNPNPTPEAYGCDPSRKFSCPLPKKPGQDDPWKVPLPPEPPVGAPGTGK